MPNRLRNRNGFIILIPSPVFLPVRSAFIVRDRHRFFRIYHTGRRYAIKQRENLPCPFFWNSFSDCSGPYFFCEEQTRAEKTSAFSARVFIGVEAIAFRQIGKESAHCGMPCRIRKCRTLCRQSWLIFLLPRTRLFILDCWSSCLRKSFSESGLSAPVTLSDAPMREIDG